MKIVTSSIFETQDDICAFVGERLLFADLLLKVDAGNLIPNRHQFVIKCRITSVTNGHCLCIFVCVVMCLCYYFIIFVIYYTIWEKMS